MKKAGGMLIAILVLFAAAWAQTITEDKVPRPVR
jgi:hypothetical protein